MINSKFKTQNSKLQLKTQKFLILGCIFAFCILSFEISYAGKFNKLIYPLKVTDETGYTIKLPKPPERIISGIPSVTEMLFALGAGDRVVGVTENCNFPPAAKMVEKVGRESLNLEKIISLKPDLIVMLYDAQRQDIKKLREFGLPVYAINPHSVSDVLYSLSCLGTALNREHAAYSLIEKMKRKLRWVEARMKLYKSGRKRVFVMVGNHPIVAAGRGTFVADVIRISGGINIAAKSYGPYPQYNLEKLVEENPDVIIIAKNVVRGEEEIYNDSQWQGISAVLNKKVLLIDQDIISRPGPRVIYAIEEIATFMHNFKEEIW